MVVAASQYERELRSLLEGERTALRHYARYLAPEARRTLDRLERGPFLVVRAAGSHGFDLVAMRAGFAFPIEAKASADEVIRFSSASGRMTDQLHEHLEAAKRGGLVVLYAYRRLGSRAGEPWRLFTPQTENHQHGRVEYLRNHLPPIERTKEGNGVLRWENGLPLSAFLERLFSLFDPDAGAERVRVHVESTGLTRFGRRPETLVDLLAEAGSAALEGVGRKPVDAVLVGTMAAGSLSDVENVTSRLAERLSLESAAGWRVEAASATGAAVFHAAALAVASGQFRRVLAVAGEKMTDLPTADVARILARSLAPQEQAAGATMPALAALVAQLYSARHGTTTAAFDLVTVLARAAAARNPMAHFSTPVTAEEVASSRMVSTPLRLLHCSAITDGAAAVVLSKGDGAASVLGLGQGFDQLLVSDREDVTSFRASRVAAERAYTMAKLTRKEVAFAELHDAFAPFLLIDLEDIGVCGPGEAGRWLESGAIAPEGRFPVNPSGGLLGRGHPVGASGLAQIVEVCRQLSQEAGPTQLPHAGTVGLAQSIGGLASHNFVTLLGRRGTI